MKALVGAFNQEKALVRAFSVIVTTGCGTDGSFYSTTSDITNMKVPTVETMDNWTAGEIVPESRSSALRYDCHS